MKMIIRANVNQRNMKFRKIHSLQSSKCFNFTLGYLIINDRVRDMSRWLTVFPMSRNSLGHHFSDSIGKNILAYARLDTRMFPRGLSL